MSEIPVLDKMTPNNLAKFEFFDFVHKQSFNCLPVQKAREIQN